MLHTLDHHGLGQSPPPLTFFWLRAWGYQTLSHQSFVGSSELGESESLQCLQVYIRKLLRIIILPFQAQMVYLLGRRPHDAVRDPQLTGKGPPFHLFPDAFSVSITRSQPGKPGIHWQESLQDAPVPDWPQIVIDTGVYGWRMFERC